MSGVERYNFVGPSGRGKSPTGKYVLASDYDALLAERDLLLTVKDAEKNHALHIGPVSKGTTEVPLEGCGCIRCTVANHDAWKARDHE